MKKNPEVQCRLPKEIQSVPSNVLYFKERPFVAGGIIRQIARPGDCKVLEFTPRKAPIE